MEKQSEKIPTTETQEILSEEERYKAARSLNIESGLGGVEIGKAYYRSELAQKGLERVWRLKEWAKEKNIALPKDADWDQYKDSVREWFADKLGLPLGSSWREVRSSEESVWLKTKWADPGFRNSLYDKNLPVSQKIRDGAALNREAENKGSGRDVGNNEDAKEERETRQPFESRHEINFADVSEIPENELEKIRNIIINAKRIVTHGDKIRDKDSEYFGAVYMKPDLDAKLASYLFGIARADNKPLEFASVRAVGKGAHLRGSIVIDTGERPQSITLAEDGTLFIDHHGEQKAEHTSAFKITYDLLKRLKMVEGEPWLDALTNFMIEVDNLSYDISEEFYKNTWWRTIYAVYEYVPFENIIEFFKEGRKPSDPLPEAWKSIAIRHRDTDIKTMGDLCDKKRADVFDGERGSIAGLRVNERDMEDAEKRNLEFTGRKFKNTTPEIGKFLINLMPRSSKNPKQYEHRMPPDQTMIAARAIGGYDTVITWNELNKSIKIESSKDLYPLFLRLKKLLPGIKAIRGSMIIESDLDYKVTQKRAVDINTILNAIFDYQQGEPLTPEGPTNTVNKKVAEILGISPARIKEGRLGQLREEDIEFIGKSVELSRIKKEGRIELKRPDNDEEAGHDRINNLLGYLKLAKIDFRLDKTDRVITVVINPYIGELPSPKAPEISNNPIDRIIDKESLSNSIGKIYTYPDFYGQSLVYPVAKSL